MEVIDVLTPGVTTGAHFTVNLAVDSVNLASFSGVPEFLYAGNGGTLFALGDNFVVLSIGYFVPERFVLAEFGGTGNMPVATAQLFFYDNVTTVETEVGGLGDDGMIRVPFANYEMSVGTFVRPAQNRVEDIPSPVTNPFRLKMKFPITSMGLTPQVSMINVPAALDGKDINVTPFVKILHNTKLA